MHLILMRHGEPLRGAANACDPPLSPSCREHVRSSARVLLGERIDVLYSSPQRRARESANLVGDVLGLSPVLEDGLAEFDFGSPYVHYDDGTAPAWQSYLKGDLSPWGLSAEAFHTRIERAMRRLAARHEDGRILAVCHGGVINAWICQILGVRDRIHAIEPQYASLHRFAFCDGQWHAISLNETASHTLSTTK